MTFDLSVLHKNKTVSSVVGLFLVLYGCLSGPKLPGFIRSMFENPVFRVVILALIMYRGNKDPQLSLMLSVGFIMVMNQLNEEKIKENFDPMEFKSKADKKIGFEHSSLVVLGGIILCFGGFLMMRGESD